MAVVRRVGLFSREIIERLSIAGVEMVLSGVSKLSEGQVLADERYYGSTMLTVDLRDVQQSVRDSCDVATGMRLARLWVHHEAVTDRVRAIAHAEAERIANQPLTLADTDMRIRCEGTLLFIDVDVEAYAEAKEATNGAA